MAMATQGWTVTSLAHCSKAPGQASQLQSLGSPAAADTGVLTLAEGEPFMMQVSTLTTWTAMASASWSSTLGRGGLVSTAQGQGVRAGGSLE